MGYRQYVPLLNNRVYPELCVTLTISQITCHGGHRLSARISSKEPPSSDKRLQIKCIRGAADCGSSISQRAAIEPRSYRDRGPGGAGGGARVPAPPLDGVPLRQLRPERGARHTAPHPAGDYSVGSRDLETPKSSPCETSCFDARKALPMGCIQTLLTHRVFNLCGWRLQSSTVAVPPPPLVVSIKDGSPALRCLLCKQRIHPHSCLLMPLSKACDVAAT